MNISYITPDIGMVAGSRDENKQYKNLARLNNHYIKMIKIIKISNRTRQLVVQVHKRILQKLFN